MPKKFSMLEKRKWLQAYESGTTEAEIAKGGNCIIRTVHKGTQEARLERDGVAARADLIKDALRKHNENLLSVIGELLPVLIRPTASQRVPVGGSSGAIPITGGKAQFELWPAKSSQLHWPLFAAATRITPRSPSGLPTTSTKEPKCSLTMPVASRTTSSSP